MLWTGYLSLESRARDLWEVPQGLLSQGLLPVGPSQAVPANPVATHSLLEAQV